MAKRLVCTAPRFEGYTQGDVIPREDEERMRRLYPHRVMEVEVDESLDQDPGDGEEVEDASDPDPGDGEEGAEDLTP